MLEHVVGCPIVIFRAFNIYGEGFSDSLINRLISRKVTLRSPNDYWRDYINVQDVVRFIRYSVADDFKDGVHIFNLGTGTAYSSMAIVEYLQGLGFQLNYKVKEDGIFTVSWADTEKLLKKFYTVPDYHLHFS
jgi:nucleoside-diphosphate-sugar epimerase